MLRAVAVIAAMKYAHDSSNSASSQYSCRVHLVPVLHRGAQLGAVDGGLFDSGSVLIDEE